MATSALLFIFGLTLGILLPSTPQEVRAAFAFLCRKATAAKWWLFAATIIFLLTIPRLMVSSRFPELRVKHRNGSKTLVVAMHGMSGVPSHAGLLDIVHDTYPDADVLAPLYPSDPLSNVDPYDLADAVEQTIDSAYREHAYRKIVLFGHSMGAVLLRKVLVWAYGSEDDRYATKGRRLWVQRVDRFVSLAGINRGWSINPAPQQMGWPKYLAIYFGEKFARLTGTGKLILSLQRGAPFVADLRIQWIRAARAKKQPALPPVIHLLGNIDDIVTAQDSRDIAVSRSVTFVTIPNVGHGDIAEALRTRNDDQHNLRRLVRDALTLPPNQIRADVTATSSKWENKKVARVVYIMHGIRDWATWGDDIRQQVMVQLKEDGRERGRVAIVPAKYGYFPMAPFILAWDRQKNVRWFMDQFTDDVVRYPNLRDVDYLGHSNGTYILASALRHYRTLKVRNIYFAGSVVPTYYPWKELLDAGRVKKVTNAVATGDWVVAIFPKFFEQLALWSNRPRVSGFFDIGAAGFRGFLAAQEADRRVENIKFVNGGHDAGIEIKNHPQRLNAILRFVKTGQADQLLKLNDAKEQCPVLSLFSDISWFVWVVLAILLVLVGWALQWLGTFISQRLKTGARWSSILVTVYILTIIALLNSL